MGCRPDQSRKRTQRSLTLAEVIGIRDGSSTNAELGLRNREQWGSVSERALSAVRGLKKKEGQGFFPLHHVLCIRSDFMGRKGGPRSGIQNWGGPVCGGEGKEGERVSRRFAHSGLTKQRLRRKEGSNGLSRKNSLRSLRSIKRDRTLVAPSSYAG